MRETIEFDRFVGVHVSRKREAGVVGDADLLYLDDDLFERSALSRIVSLLLHDVDSMGSVVTVVCHLLDYQSIL